MLNLNILEPQPSTPIYQSDPKKYPMNNRNLTPAPMAETILHHTSYHKPPCGSSHFMIFEEWDFDFKEEWVLL